MQARLARLGGDWAVHGFAETRDNRNCTERKSSDALIVSLVKDKEPQRHSPITKSKHRHIGNGLQCAVQPRGGDDDMYTTWYQIGSRGLRKVYASVFAEKTVVEPLDLI